MCSSCVFYYNLMTIKTSASEHARSGSVRIGLAITVNASIHNVGLFSKLNRFGSALFGLRCEWGLRRLANPRTTRHVFNAYLADNATRREWPEQSEAQSSQQQRRDRTRRERRGAIEMA